MSTQDLHNDQPVMSYYRLTRIDPSAPDWALTKNIPSVVQVFAQDEPQARYAAACKFLAPSGEHGNPWFCHDLVRAEKATLPDPTVPVVNQMRKPGAKGRPKATERLQLLSRR